MKKTMSKLRKAWLDSKGSKWMSACDSLMSHLVIARAGFECECCGKPAGKVRLQHHHLISREMKWARHAFSNAICLCDGCHRTDSRCSAHGEGTVGFVEMLQRKFPQRYAFAVRHSHRVTLQKPNYIERYLRLLDRAAAVPVIPPELPQVAKDVLNRYTE